MKGTTKSVVEELRARSESMDGQSKIEYDASLPHIIALVEQNFAKDQNNNDVEIPITVEAYGHGYAVGDDQKDRSVQVHITR